MCQTVCYSDWIALFVFKHITNVFAFCYACMYASVRERELITVIEVWVFVVRNMHYRHIHQSAMCFCTGKHTVKMATIWWNMAHMNGSNYYEPTAHSIQKWTTMMIHSTCKTRADAGIRHRITINTIEMKLGTHDSK